MTKQIHLEKETEDRYYDWLIKLVQVPYKDDHLLKEFDTFIKPLLRTPKNELQALDEKEVLAEIRSIVPIYGEYQALLTTSQLGILAKAICQRFGTPANQPDEGLRELLGKINRTLKNYLVKDGGVDKYAWDLTSEVDAALKEERRDE